MSPLSECGDLCDPNTPAATCQLHPPPAAVEERGPVHAVPVPATSNLNVNLNAVPAPGSGAGTGTARAHATRATHVETVSAGVVYMAKTPLRLCCSLSSCVGQAR